MADISRGGNFGGYARNKFGSQIAAKHNQIVAANLKIGMMAVPKYLLGAYAATILNEAIRKTKHDSSRFAANWNLLIGSEPAPDDGKASPYKYGDTGARYGSIGKKGSKGRHMLGVLAAKRSYYGYKKAGATYCTLTKGRLADALYPRAGVGGKGSLQGLGNVDKAGAPPKIFLYNPFMRPDWVPFRKDTWSPLSGDTSSREGKTYPQNALPHQGVTELAEGISGVMGGGLLQELIVSLNAKMRKANSDGTILDPFK